MSEEKSSQCLPSQVTINIGTSGVKVNDGDPAVDTSKFATKEELAGKATKADVSAVDVKVEQVRTVAGKAAADAVEAKAIAGKALTKEAADGAYATKAQVAGIAESVRSAKADATSAKATANDALAKATEKGDAEAAGEGPHPPRAGPEPPGGGGARGAAWGGARES